MIGIELDRFDAQAHNGLGYFETKHGHGYALFKTINEIKRIIPMDKLETPKDKKRNDSFGHHKRRSQRLSISGGLSGGDRTNIAVDDE